MQLQPPRKALRNLIYVGLALLGIYFGACYRMALGLVRPARSHLTCPAELRDALIPTRFGNTPAWCTPGLADRKPSYVVFVLVHGFGGSRGSWTDLMDALGKRGYDSVVPCMPGQDASPVHQVGFGIPEAHVVVDTVKWVRSQSTRPVKVVVLGVSLGGSASWIAGSEDPTIDAIVTESAFANFGEAMNRFFDRKFPGGSVVLSPVIFFARRITGIDPATVNPIEQAKAWRGKMGLVIQAGDDSLVTPDQGERLADATQCPYWLVPGATHSKCSEVDPTGYVEHLTAVAEALESGSFQPKPFKKVDPRRLPGHGPYLE